MRIAQVASNAEAVPPEKYGGTERVVYTLTEQLVKRGHEVTLFASGDSHTSAKLIASSPVSLRKLKIRNPYSTNEWIMYNIALAYQMYKEFDIIHDHNWYLSLPAAAICKTPVLMTFHGPFSSTMQKIYKKVTKPYINSISKAQVRNTEGLNYTGNIYHGLDMAYYPFQEKPGDYFLFVGRLSPEKGPHFAIEVAQFYSTPLILAGKVDDIDKKYFKEYIEPYLSLEYVNWIGEVDETKRNELMSKAKCLLHPVQFREPFGLALIEAMACGCPVIAFNKGSIPEIVVDDTTGFVVNDVDEMIEVADKVDRIDRKKCRDYALKNFNASRMADEYEELYEKIIEETHHKL